MNYQDRVKKKAIEIWAVHTENNADAFNFLSPIAQEHYIKMFTPLAEKAVRDEGEAFELGWRYAYEEMKERDNNFPMCQPEEIRKDMDVDAYLQQLGYLKTEEHG